MYTLILILLFTGRPNHTRETRRRKGVRTVRDVACCNSRWCQLTTMRYSPAKQQKTKHERTTSEAKPVKSSTPIKTEGSAALPTQVRTTLTHNGKEGKDFPEVRSKNPIDVNAIPIWTNGKPLTAVDIDADLAENSKPWRLPGTDAKDFFNYGFDEYTWASYCMKQQLIENQIGQIKQEDAQMKAFMGIGGDDKQGAGAMPPMPPGMDMNDPNAMANMMQQFGMDPSQFMQGMNGFGGGMPGMGGMGGMGGQGGGQQFQQGGFGSGQNSASPNPQPGQGFQAPQGPGAAGEGYSQQQLDMMNQGMGGGGGGGGGRGRNRRGRGW